MNCHIVNCLSRPKKFSSILRFNWKRLGTHFFLACHCLTHCQEIFNSLVPFAAFSGLNVGHQYIWICFSTVVITFLNRALGNCVKGVI